VAEITNVVIGIQARSTSKRFPRKVFETIDGRPMLKHVIDACDRAARYMNDHAHKTKVMVTVALAIPEGDEIAQAFRKRGTIIVEGPEDDVLSRYQQLASRLHADYVVRVTGDCPLIPPYLITKHIKTAVINAYDYLSNVDEQARTACDGTDCEVISSRMLAHMGKEAAAGPEREHVTLIARTRPPEWARIGHIVGYLDLSNVKLSVDTPEDLERVRAAYDRVKMALAKAESLRGRQNVHRF
jgi:spore coat polysaccharide biosynthesis protein SpsF